MQAVVVAPLGELDVEARQDRLGRLPEARLARYDFSHVDSWRTWSLGPRQESFEHLDDRPALVEGEIVERDVADDLAGQVQRPLPASRPRRAAGRAAAGDRTGRPWGRRRGRSCSPRIGAGRRRREAAPNPATRGRSRRGSRCRGRGSRRARCGR